MPDKPCLAVLAVCEHEMDAKLPNSNLVLPADSMMTQLSQGNTSSCMIALCYIAIHSSFLSTIQLSGCAAHALTFTNVHLILGSTYASTQTQTARGAAQPVFIL